MNCHMPHTTYALFKAIRSHQIESPSNERLARYGTPNACNLCHLDRTLGWTRENLFVWYGQKRYPLTLEQEKVSAGALWMLRGHAAQRVIAAWHSGWGPALRASGTNWMRPLQARLLSDDYAPVRRVASMAMGDDAKLDGVGFDFMASLDKLRSWSGRWQDRLARKTLLWDRVGEAVLIDSEGRWMDSEAASLLHGRDQRPVTIQE
jgi:hypothetical protein